MDSAQGESVMIPIAIKKSPYTHCLAAEVQGDRGQKTGLKYIFIPGRRGPTSYGPFSFFNISPGV